MICPACRNVMIVVENQNIELDYCPHCSGVWFDSGELELMLERLELEDSSLPITEQLAAPEAKINEKKRRCPICNTRMKKATIGEEPPVLIDACPDGDGLWFDGGEVRTLLEQCPQQPGASEHLLNFMGSTFKANSNKD
ncbi:zf-TFIIB domain-containing protein [Chloroflexota bacterium]